MCGATGEVRLDGRVPDVAAVAAMADAMAPRGPDGAGVWSQGRVALGPSPAEDHRPVRGRRPADGRPRARADDRLERLHLQLPGAARRADRRSATASSRTATPRCCSRPTTTGATGSSTTCMGMFAFAIVERDSGRVLLGRDRLGIKPLYLTEDAAPHPVRLVAAGAAGRRRRRHPHRPGRAAPLPELPLGGAAAAARSCAASPSFRRHRCSRSNPTARRTDDHLLDTGLHPARRPQPTGRNGIGRTPFSTRCAAPSSVAWWPTSRSAACCPAGWTPA